jgi:hypothetical protein
MGLLKIYTMKQFRLLAKYFLEVATKQILFLFYRFPCWHILATFKNHSYKRNSLEMAKDLEANYYIELCAGMGDVSDNLSNRLLMNNNIRSIRASKIKYSRVNYQYFYWEKDNHASLNHDRYHKIYNLAANMIKSNKWFIFFSKIECIGREFFVTVDVLSEQCVNPQSYNWIPKDIRIKNFAKVPKKYAHDLVYDRVLNKRVDE